MDIVKFLQRKGYSQSDLSRLLGTSPANVNKWVNGDGYPSFELCVKMLKIGITTEELFGVRAPECDVDDSDFKEKVRAALMEIIA